jgi:biopolymer transport protein ExbD
VGNDISLNGQKIGRTQLQNLLERAAQEDKNRSIEILYDESRETGQLNVVKEICRKAGLRRLWVKTVDAP